MKLARLHDCKSPELRINRICLSRTNDRSDKNKGVGTGGMTCFSEAITFRLSQRQNKAFVPGHIWLLDPKELCQLCCVGTASARAGHGLSLSGVV